jgi:hypothetical protein
MVSVWLPAAYEQTVELFFEEDTLPGRRRPPRTRRCSPASVSAPRPTGGRQRGERGEPIASVPHTSS